MKPINNKAPVTCTKTISIHASPEKVWNTLASIKQWPTWQTDIRKTVLHGTLKPGTTFDWVSGGVKIHSTLHTVDPTNFLGWTGKTLGVFAIHNWTLSKENGQTRITVDESMEGIMVLLFKKIFSKNLENGLQNWLDMLKRKCEAN
jgi:hypothetical protein